MYMNNEHYYCVFSRINDLDYFYLLKNWFEINISNGRSLYYFIREDKKTSILLFCSCNKFHVEEDKGVHLIR